MQKGILLYDFLQVKGGAEQLSLTLVNNVPSSSLCVGFINTEIFPTETLRNYYQLTSPTKIMGWQTLKSLFVFTHRTKFLAEYDWVIFSGSNAPVAVHNHPNGKNILYCHTIPRFVYDLKDYYLSQATWWQKPLLIFLISYVQPRYERAVEKMDVVIANSENVKRRIKKYLNRDASVLLVRKGREGFAPLRYGNFIMNI